MDSRLKVEFSRKVLNLCGADSGASIYALLPLIDNDTPHFKGVYAFSLGNSLKIINSAVELFTSKKGGATKSSYEYKKIMDKKDFLINNFSELSEANDNEPKRISDNHVHAALALLSGIYLESFIRPIQFFLPHSSVCSGQWDLWDEIDYLNFVNSIHSQKVGSQFCEEMLNSVSWDYKMKPEDFPLIVRRRLLKEDAFDKKFSPESMIKAIIVQLARKSRPHINYETIDFSIRSFFTDLNVGKYLRVDREIEFLRKFEEEMTKIIKNQNFLENNPI